MPEEKIPIESGSGNVFADLGLRDAERLQVKADILVAISREIRRRKLTQKQAAKKMDIAQSDLSRLLGGDFRGYTVDRLTRMLTKVGYDVTVVIERPARRRKEQTGKMSVELTPPDPRAADTGNAAPSMKPLSQNTPRPQAVRPPRQVNSDNTT